MKTIQITGVGRAGLVHLAVARANEQDILLNGCLSQAVAQRLLAEVLAPAAVRSLERVTLTYVGEDGIPLLSEDIAEHVAPCICPQGSLTVNGVRLWRLRPVHFAGLRDIDLTEHREVLAA